MELGELYIIFGMPIKTDEMVICFSYCSSFPSISVPVLNVSEEKSKSGFCRGGLFQSLVLAGPIKNEGYEIEVDGIIFS